LGIDSFTDCSGAYLFNRVLLKGGFMGRLAICLALLCLLVMSCVALNPEQQEALNKLQANIDSIQAEIESTAEQIQRIYKKQADVREQLKNGELSAADAAQLLLDLSEEAKEALAHYNALKIESTNAIAEFKKLKESGVPWYQTVGLILWGLVTAYLGKEKFTLGYVVSGMVNAIEYGKDKAGIKKKCKALGSPAINKAVLKLPPSIDREPLPSEMKT